MLGFLLAAAAGMWMGR